MNESTRLTAAFLLSSILVPPALPQSLVSPETEKKIDALLARMTIEEKVGQLSQYSSGFDVTGPAPTAGTSKERFDQIRCGLIGSMLNVVGAEATRKAQQLAVENSRLKIPMIFGLDVIHGYRTMFPVPLGEAASWELDAIELSARVAATEAAAAGLHWTFAPMVDIARDARWGRIMEGAGEDPYLGARVAAARVRGFQGKDLAAVDTLAACAKHYAAYGFAEGGRDYNTVDISEQTLRNVVLPPFEAAVDAGVATVMNSFNEIGGTPATGSSQLQREILKGEWGFQGFVVSDWGSIGEMVQHGFVENLEQAAKAAIEAGSDMDMESRAYVAHLARPGARGHGGSEAGRRSGPAGAAGQVPSRPARLQPQEHRTGGADAARLLVALHRRAQHGALPLRVRPQLHDLQLLGRAAQRARDRAGRTAPRVGDRHHSGSRPGAEVVQLYLRDLVRSPAPSRSSWAATRAT